jgi:serine protease Do
MSIRLRIVLVFAIALVAGGGFWGGYSWSQRTPAAVVTLETPARTPVVPSSSTIRQAESLSEAFVEIASAVTPAVVRIETERTVSRGGAPFVPRWLRDQGEFADSMAWEDLPELASGTGIILSPDGYILTNNHVVDGADRVTVELADKRTFDADVVGTDPTTDLAVIDVGAADLPVARLGDSDESRVGEWVLAIGNPGFGDEETLDFTVTSGIISATGRPLNVIGASFDTSDPSSEYAIEDFLQTDAVINPGNSGGPLVDLGGLVIGINTAIASSTGFSQGYGFAIPSNLARRVARDLIEHGRVRRPKLGISIGDVSGEDAEVYGLPAIAGVLVYDVNEESAAEVAGLARHDVIVTIDGVRVDRVGQLQREIAQREPGDTVRIGFIRYGDTLSASMRLGEVELPPRAVRTPAEAEPIRDLGLLLTDLDQRTARNLGFVEGGGVLIDDVEPLSPADRKRIFPGMRLLSVDGRSVPTAAEARKAIRAIGSGTVVSLLLESPDGSTFIANVRQN